MAIFRLKLQERSHTRPNKGRPIGPRVEIYVPLIQMTTYKTLSRFPSHLRDLSFFSWHSPVGHTTLFRPRPSHLKIMSMFVTPHYELTRHPPSFLDLLIPVYQPLRLTPTSQSSPSQCLNTLLSHSSLARIKHAQSPKFALAVIHVRCTSAPRVPFRPVYLSNTSLASCFFCQLSSLA